jgi:hypothetical protein
MKEIRTTKEEIAAHTVDGVMNLVLRRIAEELTGIDSERWATEAKKHAYEHPINYNASTGVFEIDSMHLKVLCEEMNEKWNLEIKEINATLRTILGSKLDIHTNRKQTTATIEDSGLQKRLGDKRHVRVYRYFLNVNMFISSVIKPDVQKADDSLF